MAAISNASHVAARTTRKDRVARVSAKTIRRAHDRAEAGGEASREPARRAKADATYLSMYFRDMAALDVLRPEEEFTSAREIEALEIMLWEAVLAHAPAVAAVLDAVALVPDFHAHPEVKVLRRVAEGRDQKGFARTAVRVAKRLRSADVDHLFIEAALGAVDRLTLGIGVRGSDVPALGRGSVVREWLRRVHAASRAAADARNDFVKANLRLVVSIARRFNHGRMALADLIQEGNLGLLTRGARCGYPFT
jgi:RNA polymerase primary sigma factor